MSRIVAFVLAAGVLVPAMLGIAAGTARAQGDAGLGATEPPVLATTSPPELASVAERVRGFDMARLGFAMRLTGLTKAGPPIQVALVTETSDAARSVPEWVSGYARGSSGTIVLIPARAGAYPYGSLESLLHHEVTHVLVARAAGGRPVPRWFNEGLAMVAARERTMGDRSRLFLELLPGSRFPASRLDELFDRTSRGGADRAYALSAAYVRDLVYRYGPDFPGAVLAGVARGQSFEEAFRRSTGVTLDAATVSFYRRQNFWSLWLPALTSGATFWTVVALLAVWAAKKRREKSERIRRAWEVEEDDAAALAARLAVVSPPAPPTNGAAADGRGES